MPGALTAVIFDMDGVLIDTEPTWRTVEHDVFARSGVELSDEQLRATWGMRIAEVVDHWCRERPWNGVRPQAVQREIVREMVAHVGARGEPMPGALEAIATARAAGMRIGIASSSSRELIDAVVAKLGIGAFIEAACSADDEVLGKPAPAVYLRAAQQLEALPAHCLAIEDSPAGVQAALAAGMLCVGVRTGGVLGRDIGAAHCVIESLRDFTPALLEQLADTNTARH